MSRELRTRARARIQPDTDDESDESEADEDVPAQIPSTSIQDLINPADAQQFDQTFSDADANLNIEGAFDPVAGDKQVIPRIAYVLNFNLLYNEQQERWEPQRSSDTGNSIGGFGASTALSPSFGSFFTPLPDSSGVALLELQAQCTSNTNGTVEVDIDESGGTSSDYTLLACNVDNETGGGADIITETSIPLVQGAALRIRNVQDPDNGNAIRIVRAYPFT